MKTQRRPTSRDATHAASWAASWSPGQYQYPPAAGWSNAYSLETDGTDDYVSIDTSTEINFLHNGGTLAFWVNFDSISSGINAIGVSTSGKQFYMGLYSSSYTNSGYQGGSSYGSSGGISTGTWYHLALVGTSGGSLKTYVNASEKSSNTYTPNASNNPPSNFFLGGTNSHASGGITLTNTIDGHVDEVAIWTTALDGDALTAIYNSGAPTDLTEDSGNYDNSDALFGYWRCGDNDGGTGSTITDQGSGSNNGTLVGGSAFTSEVPS